MKKATKRPRPNEGGSYILKPGGKLEPVFVQGVDQGLVAVAVRIGVVGTS